MQIILVSSLKLFTLKYYDLISIFLLGHNSDYSNDDDNISKDIGLKYLIRQSPNKMVIFLTI